MPVNYQMTWDPATSLYLPVGVGGSWLLDFYDDFDGSSVNESKWQIMGATPWRQPDTPEGSTLDGDSAITWRPANVTVAGGELALTLAQNSGPTDLYSGALLSLWPQRHGFFEARVKFSTGFPAWWITANGIGDTLTPDVDGIEMDIAESRAFAGTPQTLQHAVHWNGYGANHQHEEVLPGVTDGAYHVFGMHWTSTFCKFYVDGSLTWDFHTVTSQRATQYMVLSMGRYPGGQTSGVAYWDYVRHWSGG